MTTKSEKVKTDHQVPTLSNAVVSRTIVGLTEIGKLDIEDFRLNYAITKTITNLSEVEKAYSKSGLSLTKKHVKVEDNGNFAIQNGFYVFKTNSDKDAYEKGKEALDNQTIDVKVWTMKTSVLKDIKGIKATWMAMCAELITDDANILGD